MQVPREPRQPPSPIHHPPSPIRHPDPEQPWNDPIPPANNSRGSRGNRASDQNQGNNVPECPRSNQQNRTTAHPMPPWQHDKPLPRMGNNGQRPLPRKNHRENSYREASVGYSQSASSNPGRRDRNVRREPNLREQLNQNRGLQAYQPDHRDRLNGQRDQAHPLGYPPVMPAMLMIHVNDPYAAAYAQLAAQVRALKANQAPAQAGRAYADDSDEELEPFAPHILNTPFPHGFKLPHVPSYNGTTDPGNHLSTFNIIMRASNVNHELRCVLFPTSLTGPAKSWFDKFRRHSTTSWDQLSLEFKK